MIDRRAFLAGAGLSLAISPALAVPTPPRLPSLRPGEWLGTPNFSLFVDTNKFRAGLRPFRKGGVRLEVDRGEDVPRRRALIHNYGHGGAGITLSWGCAERVREMVAAELRNSVQKPPAAARVAVVGAGVVGLTTAAELKRWAPAMTVNVLAKTVDTAGAPLLADTTSWIAGGQFEPSGVWREYQRCGKLPELHALVRGSYRRIQELKRAGQQRLYGIVDRKNYILANEEDDGFEYGIPRDVVPAAREGTLPFEPLKTVRGKEYSTWLINPTIMLPKLVSDLHAAGSRFEQRTLRNRGDLIAIDADLVINCTGLGASDILPDGQMKPVRGQLVVLKNPRQLKYMFSGGCGDWVAYMFARQDDIVIGGTYDEGRSDLNLPDDSYMRVLNRVKRIFEGDVSECTPAPELAAYRACS